MLQQVLNHKIHNLPSINNSYTMVIVKPQKLDAKLPII